MLRAVWGTFLEQDSTKKDIYHPSHIPNKKDEKDVLAIAEEVKRHSLTTFSWRYQQKEIDTQIVVQSSKN